jgi:hypothetical protein
MEDDVKLSIRMLAAVLLMLSACSRNEPRNVQAASEERQNTAEEQLYAAKQLDRNDYIDAIDNRLAGFEQKFDTLDFQASGLKGPTKAKFMNSIQGLRDQEKAVASELDDLKKLDIESWTTPGGKGLRAKVDASLANLERSYTQVWDLMYEQYNH